MKSDVEFSSLWTKVLKKSKDLKQMAFFNTLKKIQTN